MDIIHGLPAAICLDPVLPNYLKAMSKKLALDDAWLTRGRDFNVECEHGDGAERSYLGTWRCIGFRYRNGKTGATLRRRVTRDCGSENGSAVVQDK
jgi:hypothetical protein